MSDGSAACLIDLVAEPFSSVEPPLRVELRGIELEVDTEHEIMVNKLCALLGRSEVRDLEDVKTLLEHGADLAHALADAPRKDGGFSPLTLAWTLRGLQIPALARVAGYSPEQAEELARFKEELIQHLLQESAPESRSS